MSRNHRGDMSSDVSRMEKWMFRSVLGSVFLNPLGVKGGRSNHSLPFFSQRRSASIRKNSKKGRQVASDLAADDISRPLRKLQLKAA